MKIAALVSGGVDSSVALALLKEQGHDVTAFYLKIWLEDELQFLGECPWEEDLKYVEAVCKQLSVPLQILNLQKEYFELVVNYAINEVKNGRTPNPDMFCNARIKFGIFYDKIDRSFQKIATGHYADTEMIIDKKTGTKKTYLCRVPDQIKDQTYFLAHISQEQAARALFPIGKYKKNEVRELAKKFDLPNKDRKDSQGICFLGKIKYNDFLKQYFGEKPGDFVDVNTGKVVGEHKGHFYHTVGQRKGTGLGQGPWYVVRKDIAKNIVYVSNKYQEDAEKVKPRNNFFVGELNWIADRPTTNNLKVKVRHGPQTYNCTIKDVAKDFNEKDRKKKNKADDILEVTIDGQDQGLAPGQFAVFYDERYCYGCGVILDDVKSNHKGDS